MHAHSNIIYERNIGDVEEWTITQRTKWAQLGAFSLNYTHHDWMMGIGIGASVYTFFSDYSRDVTQYDTSTVIVSDTLDSYFTRENGEVVEIHITEDRETQQVSSTIARTEEGDKLMVTFLEFPLRLGYCFSVSDHIKIIPEVNLVTGIVIAKRGGFYTSDGEHVRASTSNMRRFAWSVDFSLDAALSFASHWEIIGGPYYRKSISALSNAHLSALKRQGLGFQVGIRKKL